MDLRHIYPIKKQPVPDRILAWLINFPFPPLENRIGKDNQPIPKVALLRPRTLELQPSGIYYYFDFTKKSMFNIWILQKFCFAIFWFHEKRIYFLIWQFFFRNQLFWNNQWHPQKLLHFYVTASWEWWNTVEHSPGFIFPNRSRTLFRYSADKRTGKEFSWYFFKWKRKWISNQMSSRINIFPFL